MELAQYTPQEIKRLQKGAEIHNEKKERAQKRGSTPSPDQRRRESEALEKYK